MKLFLPTSNTTERHTFLTSSKGYFHSWSSFLEQKKNKTQKDAFKIFMFLKFCQDGRISLTGTEDGSVQIVADPACWTANIYFL